IGAAVSGLDDCKRRASPAAVREPCWPANHRSMRACRVALEDAGAEAFRTRRFRGLVSGCMRGAWCVAAVRSVAVAGSACRRIQLADDLRVGIKVGIVVVVGTDVAGLLGSLFLLLEGLDYRALDDFAAGGVDRMCDVGVQLGSAVLVAV